MLGLTVCHNSCRFVYSSALAILVTLAISTPAFSSETRVTGLQYSLGVRDEVEVFQFPSTIVDYSVVLMELGTATDSNVYGGAFTSMGEHQIGLVVNREQSLMGSGGAPYLLSSQYLAQLASNTDSNAILPVPQRPIDFFYGKAIDANSSWGLRLSLAGYVDNEEATEGHEKSKLDASSLSATFGYSLRSRRQRTDLALTLGLIGNLKSKNETDTQSIEHEFKRRLAMAISARRVVGTRTQNKFIGLTLMRSSPETKYRNGSTEESGKFSELVLALEGGVVAQPIQDTLFHAGIGLAYISSKGPVVLSGGIGSDSPPIISLSTTTERVKRTTLGADLKLGVESIVYGGLGVFGGLSYNFFGSVKNRDDISKTKSETSLLNASNADIWDLGIFYKANAFRIDSLFRKAFLNNGPFVLTGAPTSSNFFQISMTYQI